MTSPEPLGVGLLYNPAVPELLGPSAAVVDFLSVTPERFWHDRGPDSATRFSEAREAVTLFEQTLGSRPLVAHGIALSIGTAGPLDGGLLRQIETWRRRYDVRWYSEHLNALVVPGDRGRHAGVALPVPYDHDVLDELAVKVAEVQDLVALPFLLENGVAYCPIPDMDLSEPAFLNELSARSGSRVLLDLHNLFVEAVNHELSLDAYLGELDLDLVIEVHLAGGNVIGKQYTDAHAGACPETVWHLLDVIVAQAPNLSAVTFEFHESYARQLGVDGLYHQLERAQQAWAKRGEHVAA